MSANDSKGDYKVVIDQDSEPALAPSRNASIASQGGMGSRGQPPSGVDAFMNHPALPVLCYCASSILMTVRSCMIYPGPARADYSCLATGRQQRVLTLTRARAQVADLEPSTQSSSCRARTST